MSSPLDASPSAFEHLPAAVAGLAADGVVAWANPTCCALLGRTPQELAGMPASALFAPEDREELLSRHALLRAAPGTPVTFDARLRRGDGETMWAQVTAVAAPDGDGDGSPGILAVIADVTAPKLELEQARASDSPFRVLMEASPNAVVCVDEDGVIQIVNPASLRMFGYAREELVGRRVEELIPARFRPGHEHVRGHYGRHPDRRPMGAGRDLFALRNDGTEFPVEISLGPATLEDGLLVQTQVVDITDRKSAEDELRRRAIQQAAVARLGERALEGVTVPELFTRAAELVAEALDVPFVKVLELEPGEDSFVLRAAVGWPGELIDVARVGRHETQAGATLQSERPVVVDGLDRRPDLFPGPGLLRGYGIVAGASAVIGSLQDPVGVLGAHALESRTFTSEDLDFLQAAANILADAIARRHAETQIRHQALHDPLTGLANRDLLLHHVSRALAEEPRTPARHAAVIFIDLDHFKTINDSLGHDTGDALLRGVARRLVHAVRPADVVARFGGDEFVVLCEGLAGPAEASALVDRIVRALADPFDLGRTLHTVTASIGVALSGGQAADADALLRNADAAMYRAKGSGRARFELFSDEMHEHALRRLRLEGALRKAADRSELTLLYQPILALASEQVAGFEALVRWRRRGEIISPADFIPVAEETGVMRAIGGQVLREACVQAAAWQERCPSHPGAAVSVNLSPRQLADPHIVDSVAEALADSGADPGRLRLELTETALMGDHHAAVRTCTELTALGVSLVLDDFGTGFSSLSHLGRYPIDTVKIDRSFVADLTVDAGARGIVAAVLTMAAGFGARVVAEGVERPDQARVLREMGCELAQGFLFSPAVPAEAAGPWLDASPSATAA